MQETCRLEVKQVSQKSAPPAFIIIAILVLVPIPVPVPVSIVLRIAGLSLEDFIKLASIQPDSPAGRAKVNLNAISIRNV